MLAQCGSFVLDRCVSNVVEPTSSVRRSWPARPRVEQSLDEQVQDQVVLVVDDDEEHAFIVAELLFANGISALSSSDPMQVVADFSDRPLQAVILDMKMPGITGPQLLIELRRAHPDLPAILLTGYGMHDKKVVDAMGLGNVVYIAKPVTGRAIATVLADLIRQ